MARDIITNATQATPAVTSAQAATATNSPANIAAPAKQDALAEAFPEWNLVPAVPFVRRVK